MTVLTPEQQRISNQLAGNLATAEVRNQTPASSESIGNRVASIIRQVENKSEPRLIERLSAQLLGYLQQLQQDQGKISQQDYDSQLKPQENQLRQLIGRLKQNPQDQDALSDLQAIIPVVGISLQRFYPERQASQPAIPAGREAAPKPAGEEGEEGETEQTAQIETALKTREVTHIMEIAEGIMDNADKVDYKRGGKYALVRYVPCTTQFGEPAERPVFVPENYVRWFRDRMMAIADDISPNKFDAFWNSIAIDMGFRRVNFFKMYDLANAWKQAEIAKNSKGEYMVEEAVDKKGNRLNRAKIDKKTNRPTFIYDLDNSEQLEGLKEEITNTVTMTNYIYQNDTIIRPDAGSEEGFAKAFYEAGKDNNLTKNAMGSGYGHMYYLNEASKHEVDMFKKSGNKERGKVGQAAQIATLLYYNLRHIDKDPNWYGYFEYQSASPENYIKRKKTEEGEEIKEIEIPKWIICNGKRLEVDENGIVTNPPNSEEEKKKIKPGQNIFDNILNAEVKLQMGRKDPNNPDKALTIQIDGVKEFYGSLARQVLLQELEKQIESTNDKTKKDSLTKHKEAIEAANKAGIDWLSPVDQNRKEDYEKRIRPLIAGEEGKFNTDETLLGYKKGMSNEKWDALWHEIADLPNKMTTVISQFGASLPGQTDEDKEIRDVIKGFSPNHATEERKKFAFTLLQANHIIKDPEDLNIFNNPLKSKAIIDIVKGAVIDTIRAKTDMDDREDAKFADFLNRKLWDAFMMYAPNDTGYVGFKGYSKVVNVRGYRRKSVDYRSEKNGNLFDIDDIKMLLLDPLRAWNVSDEGKEEYKRSFLREVQGGEGYEVNLNDMKRFTFKSGTNGTEKGWASDPVSNSAKVYQALVDPNAIDFLKDLSWGPNGDLQRGPGFRAMMELLHDIRYSMDRGYPYDKKVDEWYQDDQKHWHVRSNSTKETMFSNSVIGLDMYDPESKTLDGGHQRFPPDDEKKKMGRNLFFFIMQRWILARRISSSGLPPISRSEIELIRTAYKTFPTAWRNKNGRQVADDFMLMADEWNRIENGFEYEGKKYEGFHTKQTRGVDFVEHRAVQGVGNFVGQSFVAVRDLAKLLLKTDWH